MRGTGRFPLRAGAWQSAGIAMLIPAAMLAGCSALQAPSAIFDLGVSGNVAEPRSRVQVLVPEPTAVRALDTERIAARPSSSQYAYLPGAVWSDRLPKLLQARLVQTLQNSGKVRAAAVPGQGMLTDYQLVLDVRAFELTEEGAVVDFAVRLMDDRDGRVVRSRVFRYGVAVASRDAANQVAALDKARDLAFADIIRWAFGG